MIFQYTNENPGPIKIWQELQKIPTPSSHIPISTIRTLMWLMLSAGKDFKGTKDTINKVLSGDMDIGTFISNFERAIKNKHDIVIKVPTEGLKVPTDVKICVDKTHLDIALPICIFKTIFIKANIQKVQDLAKTVWNVTGEELTNIDLDYHMLTHTDGGIVTPYAAQMLTDEQLFLGHFRKFFISDYNPNSFPYLVADKDRLKQFLRSDLLTAAQSKNKLPISLPGFRLSEGDTCAS